MMSGWKLEGGGPWKILEECKSPRHCTLYAGKHGCICPRAKYLYELNLVRMRNTSREYRHRLIENAVPAREKSDSPGWFKAGPWKISALCNARGHNNLTWARGSTKNAMARCTCPHALWLLEEYKKNQLLLEKDKRTRNKLPHRHVSAPLAAVIPEPNWSRGACGQDVAAAEMGFNEDVSKKGIASRAIAKELCQDCPLSMFRECGAWIKAKEGSTPGVFGGVYAGQDRWNRQGFKLAVVGGVIRKVTLDSADVN